MGEPVLAENRQFLSETHNLSTKDWNEIGFILLSNEPKKTQCKEVCKVLDGNTESDIAAWILSGNPRNF